MLSVAVQGIQPRWRCSNRFSADTSIYHLTLTCLLTPSLCHKSKFSVVLLPIIKLAVSEWVSVSLNDMATQHFHVCWSSGSNTPGHDAALLNFRLLWGTRLSHWHLLLLALVVIKTFLVSLLLLVSKVCTLGNYFCGWNARQKKYTRRTFWCSSRIHP